MNAAMSGTGATYTGFGDRRGYEDDFGTLDEGYTYADDPATRRYSRYGTSRAMDEDYGRQDQGGGARRTARQAGGKASRWAGEAGDMLEDNAVPLALIGLGAAWLILGGGKSSGSKSGGGNGQRGGTLARTGGRVREGLHRMGDRAGHAMDSMRHGAEELRRKAGERLHRTGEQVRSKAASESREFEDDDRFGSRLSDLRGRSESRMRRARRQATGTYRQVEGRVNDIGRSFWDMVEEHPLAAGLAGLALGAALGATLPGTRTENEWLGDTSDEVMRRARRQGSDMLDRAGHVAREAAEAGVDAARERGSEAARREGLTGKS